MNKVYGVYHKMYCVCSMDGNRACDVLYTEISNEDDRIVSSKEKAVEYANKLVEKYKSKNGENLVNCLITDYISDIVYNKESYPIFLKAQQKYGTDNFRHTVEVLEYNLL